ncbi:hypothetical protein A2U01_0118577, partial [Trifolium medium]|nr:hypothetical protein [Trifolium medium]
RLQTDHDEEAMVEDVCGIGNFIGVDLKGQPAEMTNVILEAEGRGVERGKRWWGRVVEEFDGRL